MAQTLHRSMLVYYLVQPIQIFSYPLIYFIIITQRNQHKNVVLYFSSGG